MDFSQYAKLYQKELLTRVLPFWLNHSMDREFGGYFTCLLEDGKVFDQDKFVWLQARQVWTFSMLYNQLEKNQQWLEFAIHGADYLMKHGRAENGDWYFSLDREGNPLMQPYNIFSDCFSTMAFGQLFRATGSDIYASIAKSTFERILERKENPKGKYTKTIHETRPLKNFAMPMILSNLVLEIEEILEGDVVEQTIRDCIGQVTEDFYDGHTGLILENVSLNGQFIDSFDGRLLNPGHAIEATWFIMDLAHRNKDDALLEKAVDIMLNVLAFGWDELHEGIFYFMDIKGYPPQQLEWDQKLWWVHLETLVALLKGYHYTGRTECLEWFKVVHAYTWNHFPDALHGEWYGYLNRQGEVLLHLKGGKWKGCFHVPRALFQCWQILEQL